MPDPTAATALLFVARTLDHLIPAFGFRAFGLLCADTTLGTVAVPRGGGTICQGLTSRSLTVYS